MPPGPIVRYPKLREMSEKGGDEPGARGSGVDEVEKSTFWKMSRKIDKFGTSSCCTTLRKKVGAIALSDMIQESVKGVSDGSGLT